MLAIAAILNSMKHAIPIKNIDHEKTCGRVTLLLAFFAS